ncbi:MAG: flagellar biosynthesis protein FlgA, partial [Candidatus Eremiobacteraeota bacterium]|nr:flagellar biosynthesis protein FlgA [Candidatus Eremiobacteraeota bacterium]
MNLAGMLAAREEAGRPIRVAQVGAGKFGTMILAQLRLMKGVRLCALADLDVERARDAAARANWEPERFAVAETVDRANAIARSGKTAIVPAGELAARCDVDVVIEVTGHVEAGTRHALVAMDEGHHVIMVTVEADVVVGPMLHAHAKRCGVIYSLAYGDQPAIICEMIDWARTCGFTVTAAGKGTQYLPKWRYSTPDTALRYFGFTDEQIAHGGFNPRMFNSFLDGTKSAIEMNAIANATGLGVPEGGLTFAPVGTSELAAKMRPKSEGGLLEREGILDVVTYLYDEGKLVPDHIRYGVFVCFTSESTYAQRCFGEYGMHTDPSGKYTALWRPYHLIGLEIGISIASVALRGEPTGTASYGPIGETVCATRKAMKAGETIDGEGGYA